MTGSDGSVPKRLVVGITGGISTGKSTVLEMLRKLGCQAISADDLAREILAPGEPAYSEVLDRFGRDVLAADGTIDRSLLARIVFADKHAREDLNRITHPRIIQKLQSAINEFRDTTEPENAVLAVEIPLLFECNLRNIVDHVLVVAAEQEIQLSRLTTRTGITRDEAVRRIQSQLDLNEKVRMADYVIWNNGTLEDLEQAVNDFWQKLQSVKGRGTENTN